MSEIGDEVVVLRHPGAAKTGRRGLVAMLVLGPLVIALVMMAADFDLNVPERSGHLSLIPSLIAFGGFLASALIALPGLMMLKRERLTEELHLGSLGMELRQTQPRTSGAEVVTCWRLMWSDVAQTKLSYRHAPRSSYAAVDIRTRSGMEQKLYVNAWQPVQGGSGDRPTIDSRVLSLDADVLRATPLAKALAAKGLKVEDETPRPQDRLAARLGLGLGIGAIVAALIFSYFVEH